MFTKNEIKHYGTTAGPIEHFGSLQYFYFYIVSRFDENSHCLTNSHSTPEQNSLR